MSKHYIYKMEILENDTYHGIYIGQHKIGKKDPDNDGYKGSGSMWKKHILNNHIPVKKTVIRICDDIDETNFWELFYIEQAIASGEYLWNVAKGGGGHESDRIYTEEEIRQHNRERNKKWCDANREYVTQKRKQYYEKNKEHITEIKSRYRQEHEEEFREYMRKYYQDNKEELSKQKRQYYEQHKEQINERKKEYGKEYRVTHAEQETERHKKYNDEHKEERNRYYNRQCFYNGEILTFRALILRFRRQQKDNPTELAKKYLITKENNYDLCIS